VKLSNGLVIPKGESVWVTVAHMWTDEYHKNPDEFDPYRFMSSRGSAKEHSSHLISTSPEHIGFGHGEHACPGRFFAANEVKILLCHLLLKYEWKFPEGHDPQFLSAGIPLMVDPEARVLFRRRKEEIDLANLEC
jgi:cytochrome P450